VELLPRIAYVRGNAANEKTVMTLGQIILSQLTDPFRIALIVALVFTLLRNRAVTGVIVPALAGIVFVAVIIPSTLGAASTEPVLRQVLVGLLSNAVILSVVAGIWQVWLHFRKP
jgi:hypothetical protein